MNELEGGIDPNPQGSLAAAPWITRPICPS